MTISADVKKLIAHVLREPTSENIARGVLTGGISSIAITALGHLFSINKKRSKSNMDIFFNLPSNFAIGGAIGLILSWNSKAWNRLLPFTSFNQTIEHSSATIKRGALRVLPISTLLALLCLSLVSNTSLKQRQFLYRLQKDPITKLKLFKCLIISGMALGAFIQSMHSIKKNYFTNHQINKDKDKDTNPREFFRYLNETLYNFMGSEDSY